MAEKFVLGKDDLDHLIRGGELRTSNGTCFILSDIGFDRVQELAMKAEQLPSKVRQIREVFSTVLDPPPKTQVADQGKGFSVPGWHD